LINDHMRHTLFLIRTQNSKIVMQNSAKNPK
jgi:hypothetical protein